MAEVTFLIQEAVHILKQLQHDSELMEYAEEIFDLKMIEIK